MNAVLQEPSPWNVWAEGMELAPGFWLDVPNGLYHAGPGISKSGLDDIDTSPRYYRTRRDNPQPPTPALLMGTALHTAILEPERFEREFRPDPAPGSYSKDAKAARQALEDEGFTVVRHNPNPETIWERGDWDTIHFVRDAVLAHPEASIFLQADDGIAELSCYWVDPSVHRLCKCRPDFYNRSHRLIVDLKSVADATLSGFQRSTHEYRYDVQAAWYQDGMRLAGELVEAMVFIAAEKKPPYHVGCYEIDAEWMRQGRVKYQGNLRTYHECMKSGEWPSIPDHTRVLPMPAYARYNPIS